MFQLLVRNSVESSPERFESYRNCKHSSPGVSFRSHCISSGYTRRAGGGGHPLHRVHFSRRRLHLALSDNASEFANRHNSFHFSFTTRVPFGGRAGKRRNGETLRAEGCQSSPRSIFSGEPPKKDYQARGLCPETWHRTRTQPRHL